VAHSLLGSAHDRRHDFLRHFTRPARGVVAAVQSVEHHGGRPRRAGDRQVVAEVVVAGVLHDDVDHVVVGSAGHLPAGVWPGELVITGVMTWAACASIAMTAEITPSMTGLVEIDNKQFNRMSTAAYHSRCR
jgi:hypothetical protein